MFISKRKKFEPQSEAFDPLQAVRGNAGTDRLTRSNMHDLLLVAAGGVKAKIQMTLGPPMSSITYSGTSITAPTGWRTNHLMIRSTSTSRLRVMGNA